MFIPVISTDYFILSSRSLSLSLSLSLFQYFFLFFLSLLLGWGGVLWGNISKGNVLFWQGSGG